MPTYLCHGFRWQRRSIRVYVIVQNLDDAAPEWIIRRGTARTLLESFYALFDFLPLCAPPDRRSNRRPRAESNGSSSYYYQQQQSNSNNNNNRSRSRSRSQSVASSHHQQLPPLDFSNKSLPPGPAQAQHDAEDDILSQDWSAVKLLEEYDPLKLDEISRPHAYVADYAVRIDLSVSILDEMARYEEAMRSDPDPAMTGAYADEGTPAARKAAAAQAQAAGGGSSRGKKQPGWLERLRDQLQRGEEIRWYVVVNGDEERNWPDEPPHRQAAAAGTAESRPPPSRQQQEHHAQYTLQQNIFEGADREREKERERLRLELAGDKDILGPTDRKPQALPPPPPGRDYYRATGERRPIVPEKDLPIPTLKPRASVDAGLRPKTPKSGGIRRLFSRSKNGDESP